MTITEACRRRRTFAIISHPDAGKTTLTEKLLLYGGAIQTAGTVKARKASQHATSDWMEIEKKRGISVTTSVMQFPYKEHIYNLLDTPGHADFSEDTYRTLTAVDCAIMVIDAAKGVEERTVKLMSICRQRAIPIITFVNKLDREGMAPLDVLCHIEQTLDIQTHAVTWPIGIGRTFAGVYHFGHHQVARFEKSASNQTMADIEWLSSAACLEHDMPGEDLEEAEGIAEMMTEFPKEKFKQGQLTPVFFGSALNNFGVEMLLDGILDMAPSPSEHTAHQRQVRADEAAFSGFVFKIQANMDKKHRDRMAFLRICSGHFEKNQTVLQVRTEKKMALNQAQTFMAGERSQLEKAYSGDIIGIPNHGGIQIGDTFTSGEKLRFMGIPNFAPELFKSVMLDDPLRQKALKKGIQQLCEEGAMQVFYPISSSQIFLGAIGTLQFDVVSERLENEYQVSCHWDSVDWVTVRWVDSDDPAELEAFTRQNAACMAKDAHDRLVFLVRSRSVLTYTQDKWPAIYFYSTAE